MIGFWKKYFYVKEKRLFKFFGFVFNPYWIKAAGASFKFPTKI